MSRRDGNGLGIDRLFIKDLSIANWPGLAARWGFQFHLYYEQVGASHVTNVLAVAWATLPVGASGGWWAQRARRGALFRRLVADAGP